MMIIIILRVLSELNPEIHSFLLAVLFCNQSLTA